MTEVVETGEKRDMGGRRMASVLRRAAMLAAYEGSGLTMSAFARREGIKYGTFTGWVYKAQGKVAAQGSSDSRRCRCRIPRVPVAVRRWRLSCRTERCCAQDAWRTR